jgi:hypothetical protein
MSASRIETLLARVATVLQSAGTGATVERRRVDAFDSGDLPVIEIMRGDAGSEPFGDKANLWRPNVQLALMVADGSMSETQIDALWCAVDTALHADADLAAMGRGLRCTSTSEPEQVAMTSGVAARMTCSYEFQLLTRRGDLSRAMT